VKNLILDKNIEKVGKHRQQAIENLIKLVQSNSTLETLSIAGGSKSDRLKHDIVPFLHALSHNRSLTSLDISGQHMGNKGTIALAKALRQNSAITSLIWDENQTGLLGFINIKNALKVNHSLKNMPLPISDIGLALKNDSQNAKEIQTTLIKLEKRILRNQQHH